MILNVELNYTETFTPPDGGKHRSCLARADFAFELRQVSQSEAPLVVTVHNRVRNQEDNYHWFDGAFWVGAKETGPISDYLLDEIRYRVDSANSRQKVVAKGLKVLADYVLIGNQLFIRSAEPCYQINTFGPGYNHGATQLMLGHAEPRNRMQSNLYSALERDQAIQAATKLAQDRKDTKSLPITPHGDFIVHRPDMLQLHRPGHDIEFHVGVVLERSVVVRGFTVKDASQKALEKVLAEGFAEGLFDMGVKKVSPGSG